MPRPAFRIRVLALALSIAFGLGVTACLKQPSVRDRGALYASKRMADGKQWPTDNLNVAAGQS